MKRKNQNWEKPKPNQWKKLIKEIYESAPNTYGIGNKGYIDDEHDLVKILKIKPHDLEKAIWFLEDQKLIELSKSRSRQMILTDKGFDVVFSLEKMEVSAVLQLGILIFTAMYVFVAIMEYLNKIYYISFWTNTITLILTVIFIVGTGFKFILKK